MGLIRKGKRSNRRKVKAILASIRSMDDSKAYTMEEDGFRVTMTGAEWKAAIKKPDER